MEENVNDLQITKIQELIIKKIDYEKTNIK